MLSRLNVQHRVTVLKFQHSLDHTVQKLPMKTALHSYNPAFSVQIHKAVFQIIQMLDIKVIVKCIFNYGSKLRRLQSAPAGWAFGPAPVHCITNSSQRKRLPTVISQVRNIPFGQFPVLVLLHFVVPDAVNVFCHTNFLIPFPGLAQIPPFSGKGYRRNPFYRQLLLSRISITWSKAV